MKEIIYSFNLQLFSLVSSGANATVASGSTGAGTVNSDLAPEMKTYYDKKLIKTAQANLVHQQFGQKRPIPKDSGKTIEFRKFGSLGKALTPISEGITPAGQVLTVTNITATVEQYGGWVMQTDMLELTAIDNTIYEATELLGQQAGLTVDTVVRNVLQANANKYFSPKVNASTGARTAVTTKAGMDATCKLTVRDIKHVVATLRAANAPTFEGGYYAGVIHPFNAFELMNDPEWEEVANYADPDRRVAGEIGRIAGVRFVETSEAAITLDGGAPASGQTTGTLPVYSTLIFGKNAYGVTEVEGGGMEVIVKQKGSAGTADPLNQRSSVGWKALITAEILIPQYMINILSTTDEFTISAAN